MTKTNVPPPQLEKHAPPKQVSKIRNLKHKYETIRAQFPRKIDGAQSSIERRPIPPKDIGSQT
jgi:hypothetical protein